MPRETYFSFPDAAYEYRRNGGYLTDCDPCDICGEQCCSPVACKQVIGGGNYRLCCDNSGCCCLYPASCRNKFWPEFSHPRWLCCKDLYDGGGEPCYDCCEEEDKESCD